MRLENLLVFRIRDIRGWPVIYLERLDFVETVSVSFNERSPFVVLLSLDSSLPTFQVVDFSESLHNIFVSPGHNR